jgi:8-amino-7-oxononanoate synthase
MNLSAAQQKIKERQQEGLYRQRVELTCANGQTYWENQPIINFASNDYLGLSQHPAVIAACQQGAAEYGVGSGASIMVSGYHAQHKQLEEALADFLGMERVLLFPNGYMANLGAINGLSTLYSQWFFDRNNHASLYDALQLNKIYYQRYQHGNYLHLAEILFAAGQGEKCIVTEGVFSMDGQKLDVDQIYNVAMLRAADLMIDDSHAMGVFGKQGRGSISHFPRDFNQRVIITSSFGKAFGCAGGFVAGDAELMEHIEQFARSFIYTTALSPAIACAVLAALQLIQAEQLQERLYQLIIYFKSLMKQCNLPLIASHSAIQALLLKSAQRGTMYHQRLLEQGFLVGLMRPPSVPAEQTCLRITLTVKHTEQMIDQLVAALCNIYRHEDHHDD